MFGRSIRKKFSSSHKAKRLRVERLESRQMLSGIVNVYTQAVLGTTPAAFVAGDVYLQGDGLTNVVNMDQPTANPAQFSIFSDGATYFHLDGTSPTTTMASVPLNDFNGNVFVDLGAGGKFTFSSPPAGPGAPTVSTLELSLNIADGAGSTNTISNAVIGGNLTVTKDTGTIGSSNLYITSSTVLGSTAITNGTPGGATGGNSSTIIDSCLLQGLPGAPALTIDNGDGFNQTTIQGLSQIGTAPLTPVANAVVILNGAEGSTTTFTGVSAATAPVIYGGVRITNGLTLPLQSNQATFNNTQVLGAVNIDNTAGGTASGDTQVSVTSSKLGTHLTLGGPLVVTNGVGNNVFSMKGSQVPWGLLINNTSGPISPVGNQTIIDSSYIGQTSTGARPVGAVLPSPAVAGDAVFLKDGNGADTVIFRNGTVINGELDLGALGGGIKNVSLDSSTMTALALATGPGKDSVWIGGAIIQTTMSVALGTGTNTLYLQKGNTSLASNSLPDFLNGVNGIDGGLGTNYLDYDATDAPPPDILHFQYVAVAPVAIPAWALMPNL